MSDELKVTQIDLDHWFEMWETARAELAAERERAERLEGVLIEARLYLSGDAPRWANLANLLARIDATLNKGGGYE